MKLLKQLRKISIPHRFLVNRNIFAPFTFSLAKTSNYCLFPDGLHTQSHSSSSPPPSLSSFSLLPNTTDLFSNKLSDYELLVKCIMQRKVRELRHELIQNAEDSDKIVKKLEDSEDWLFRKHPDNSAFVELLKQLNSRPRLALEVFNWRRRLCSFPLIAEEYAKGITVAGRSKNVDLAIELFTEASNKRIKTTSTYNALMGAYMFNSLPDKCHSLFRDLMREANCVPTIVTYNILMSVFGRLLLVDHMETTMREIQDLDLSPNVSTYNHLIAGYITAWMWDKMEQTFLKMKASSVKPNNETFLLMLRGYAHSGDLEKMEEMYELLKDCVNDKHFPLIRAMICAYCRSSVADKVKKIEALLKLIPKEEYRPWLNVLLIRVYAQEDRLEGMENLINEAFEHGTSVTTIHVMRSIITSYFRCNAVDKLTNFVSRAECSGWRICRSLYHCKMVMFASHKRFEEMEHVLDEMNNVNLVWTRKTFWLLYNAYAASGCRYKVDKVVCYMCKLGHGIPFDSCPS